MFKQYNPSTKSPYRGHGGMMLEKQSTGTEASSFKYQAPVNVSPIKQNLSKYCNDKGNLPANTNSIQNIQNRLREYQGSQGKTSVSKTLF